ncbi:MAG: DUF2817 domain-containing protein [Crenarchaeota archaeon]|nr:MAG: DUF2817 domain-containing protein [Thermoproteota archaeon]
MSSVTGPSGLGVVVIVSYGPDRQSGHAQNTLWLKCHRVFFLTIDLFQKLGIIIDMSRDIFRSYYRDVIKPLESSNPEIIGYTGKHPILYKKIGNGPHHVLISGGVHGEEIAGCAAAVDIIENLFTVPGGHFTIHVYPCMNPYGYEYNIRENAEGIDLNRGFKETLKGREVEIFAEHVKKLNYKYIFTMDFHEGSPNTIWKVLDNNKKIKCSYSLEDNPHGAWLYESCKVLSHRMGDKMLQALRNEGLEVTSKDIVYDDICDNGWIKYPEAMKSEEYAEGNSFDAWLWAHYTSQAFTSETDMSWPLEDRIKAHHLMLMAALEATRTRLDNV